MDKKTQTMAFSNLIGASVFFVTGLWALLQTFGFEHVKNTYVQPATFPRIMIIGMLLFSAVVIVQSLLKLPHLHKEDPLAETAPTLNVFQNRGLQSVVAVTVLSVLFVALFKPLGYVLVSALVCIAMMWMIGKRSWVQMVLVSVLVPLVMWVVFYKVLTVNIPMGPLSFLCDLVDKI